MEVLGMSFDAMNFYLLTDNDSHDMIKLSVWWATIDAETHIYGNNIYDLDKQFCSLFHVYL